MQNIFEKNFIDFCELAFERHNIYLAKEFNKPKPWTSDLIFQKYFFCNVFRHLDKTSKFIIDNVINKNEDRPDLWSTIILCRFISYIPTIDLLLQENALFDIKKLFAILKELQAQRKKIFTGAFIFNSNAFMPYTDRVSYLYLLIKYINDKYNLNEFDKCVIGAKSLEKTFALLINLPGVGRFMASEILADMMYSQRYLKSAIDKNTWMIYGIGAIYGINRLYTNNPISKGTKYDTLENALIIYNKWQMYIADKIGHKNKHAEFKNLSLHEVEHWLCEYNKYCRIKNGGHSKRKYNGVI